MDRSLCSCWYCEYLSGMAMQRKISAFFQRQLLNPIPEGSCEMEAKRSKSSADSKVVNKKRNYAQYHLELGQTNFLLHTCSVCGLMYARGNEADEKVHKAYHKSYSEGVTFKGWRNETVVARCGGGDRVILAADENASIRNSKVQEVIKVMEKELGFSEGQLLHKFCKVYLFISTQRIVGCLVAEAIRTAHKVILNSTEGSCNDDISTKPLPQNPLVNEIDSRKPNHTLEFGKISFKREIIRRRNHSDKTKEDHWDPGAIICEEEPVPALCGFRAIWVVPSSRRKRIASQLMDAARKSFCTGEILGISQCAFSPPTSAGKALACSYCKTNTFLVYKEEDVCEMSYLRN